MEPLWLDWARRLSAIAQTGLTFAENPYHIERYTAIRTIAAEMIAHEGGATPKVDVRGFVPVQTSSWALVMRPTPLPDLTTT